jgi:sugar phosphate isomerase/epimerase
MKLAQGLGHLTYCTNIHAGEPLADVIASLGKYVPGIKQSVSADKSFGVGLRLGGQATEELARPGALDELEDAIDKLGCYVFTLNGFPYGAFHGQPVKEGAYRPDWSDPVRLSYTNALADILARLLPQDQNGTISTVPGTFKPWAQNNLDAISANLVSHVVHLVDIKRNTGKTISLSLEPEPFCFLETIQETVDYFNDHLFSATAVNQLASACGLNVTDANDALRKHLSVCYDVCHAAVEFEDPRQSVEQLRANGINIGKLQLSSALRIATLDADSLAAIKGFDEPVYLHQVVQQLNGELTRFDDIPKAVAQAAGAMGAQWRCHFHVPVFLEHLPAFGTTQRFLSDILALHREQPISEHLEVETYTWDVLPQDLRGLPLDAAIARELSWVLDQLNQPVQRSGVRSSV